MEMSKVSECEISDCAYNTNNLCHARAITIGDSTNPRCDTLCIAERKCPELGCVAGVGACKTSICMFNEGLECGASTIRVGYSENDANCLTFRPK